MAGASCFLDRVNSVVGVRAGFVGRVDGVPVEADKWKTLRRLEAAHREVLESHGLAWEQLWRAEQVHGDGVAVVPADNPNGDRIVAGVDGLVARSCDAVLGIYVADCAAVYLADRATGALALVHSGKKGTEREIVVRAVERMAAEFGARPADLEAAVSPCIRPPHYEVDFVQAIEEQLVRAGVPEGQVRVSGVCTGAEVGRYYSYRVEKGKTGRMLAFLGRVEEDSEKP